MKNVKQKNQIIITLLALLIAVSGYLNFANEGAKGVETAVSNQTMSPQNNGIETTIGQISAQDIENSTKSKSPLATKESSDTKENNKTTPQPTKKVENDKVQDSATIGQAVLVNTTINADYFYSAKLGREQVRAKNTETLMEIVNNQNLTDKQKEEATKEIINITKNAQLENDVENLLAAKGFENCVVSIGEKNADVIVDISSITLEQAAIIEDVVMRKTGLLSGNIVITPINGE